MKGAFTPPLLLIPLHLNRAVSAPGKVLLVGGYLVLDRAYTGLVIGTDSRFYVQVRSAEPHDHAGTDTRSGVITVRSPQFLDGLWVYNVVNAGDGSVELVPCIPDANASVNRYVELALRYALLTALGIVGEVKFWSILGIGCGLDITILGHNDFYSQQEQLKKHGLPVSTDSLRQLDPFCSTLTTVPNVHKTGLGSSAAMITSLVGSILYHFGAVDFASSISVPLSSSSVASSNIDINSNGLALVHNLAQLAHCAAQGKVGSGFDVSSAVYGGHLYRRFTPGPTLDKLMSLSTPSTSLSKSSASVSAKTIPGELAKSLSPLQSKEWNNEVIPFQLPPGCHLVLADVDAGSSTPKLVSGILAWRKADPEIAQQLWDELHEMNKKVENALRELGKIAELQKDVYDSALVYCASLPASKWSSTVSQVVSLFTETHNSFQDIRRLLRRMSELSGVPVEPPIQTRLLDACSELAGVLLAGVPGAGGFDAICVLVLEASSTIQVDATATDGYVTNRARVEALCSGWTEMRVCPLLTSESRRGFAIEECFPSSV